MRVLRDPIDHILALDFGGRGIAAFFVPGAAATVAAELRRARRVLITTGFVVAEGRPETDGPPGAAVLGRSLRRLGARVGYVTDATTVPVLRAALHALGEPLDVEAADGTERTVAAVLRRQRPTHLVAIERPGRAGSGDYLNARGESVARWNPPLDALFLARSGATTIAVGDGGNEVGMGNVRPRLLRQGGLLARIASVVPVEHLVVAGVSNWGAYGIVAALERLSGTRVLHGADDEERLIRACVRAGAVDGLTRQHVPTVDGFPLRVQRAVVELLGPAASAPFGPRAASGMMEAVRGAGLTGRTGRR